MPLVANILLAALTATITTPQGLIQVQLLTDSAPQTVSNFVLLTQQGFYNGSSFHRVVPGHSLTGGAPKGQTFGGPGYCFKGDALSQSARKHDQAGLVSMLSLGPGTLGSQFQITLGPAPDLDDQAPVFGTVISGLDVLEKLATAKSDAATIDKIDLVGEWTPTPPDKIPELSADQLAKILSPQVKSLAAGISQALRLGSVQSVALASSRSRCRTSQANFLVDFAKQKNAHLLIYAHATDAESAEIDQFQFERGGDL